MPREARKEKVTGRHFHWLLGTRNGVFYADGRSNTPSIGRHSLGTRDRDEARAALERLDLVQAVGAGLPDAAELEDQGSKVLTLADGWDLYRKYVSRPRVVGGAKPRSVARYKAVFDKFLAFAASKRITTWNRVDRSVLQDYAAWLEGANYAYRTAYLELTTLKQAMNWFHSAGHLLAGPSIDLTLSKPEGTDTYCWTPAEVQAIVVHCRSREDLHWLGRVVTALACTGLRISELAALRWSDVDRECNVIRLTDETARSQQKAKGERRQTKSSRSRSFPIHAELRPVLDELNPSAGVIFHGPRGGRLKPDTVRTILVRKVLAPLAERFPSRGEDLGFSEGRLHSFRHYFCSACSNSGVSEAVVMSWLGHRDSAMVKHYYHLHDQEAQRQMQRVTFTENRDGVLPSVP